jgi:hypothetical protein
MMTGGLSEEVLALAEYLYLMAVARGETKLSAYHQVSGASARLQRGWSAEDKRKWLT